VSAAHLDAEMLQALEQRLARHHAAIATTLREGCSRDAIDTRTADLGMTLPDEAARWWQWHDGSTTAGEILADFRVLSLTEACDWYRFVRGEAEANVALHGAGHGISDPDQLWPAWLFPILSSSSGTVAVDCRGNDTAPVHYVIAEEGPTGNPVIDSLGRLVRWWIEAIDEGVWQLDHLGAFASHRDRLEPDRRASGLV